MSLSLSPCEPWAPLTDRSRREAKNTSLLAETFPNAPTDAFDCEPPKPASSATTHVARLAEDLPRSGVFGTM